MRLEHLCDMELAYRDTGIGKFVPGKAVLVRPYGSEEGTGYGEGDGRVTSPKLRGKARWVNHPHRRSDGTFLPDVHGLITTDDGAEIVFTLQGRTAFKEGKGRQLLSATFEAEDERYLWLNTAFCVYEGVIDAETATVRGRIYACINELV